MTELVIAIWGLIILIDHALIVCGINQVVAELKKLTKNVDDIQK